MRIGVLEHLLFHSNKYTPDGIWWGTANRYYALVGGLVSNGLQCGGSCLYLHTAADWIGSIGASNKYTPDALHWQTDLTSYLVIGGCTDYRMKAGMIHTRLRYRDNAMTWDIGASNKYTPDAIWWNIVAKYYVLVGGYTIYGLRCGGSCLHLNDIAGYEHWLFGTSNKYTPDAFWWNNGQRDYARVGGETSDRLRCGGSSLHLHHPVGNWS